MFSDKEIQAYKKISAPAELYDKVKSDAAVKRRFRPSVIIKTMGAVAALFVITVAVMLFTQSKSPAIICNGQSLESSVLFYDVSPASDMRESPALVVPFGFELWEDVEVTLSMGRLVDKNGDALGDTFKKGSVEVWWEIPRSDEITDHEMELKGQKNKTIIKLTYNNEEKTITATKITK